MLAGPQLTFVSYPFYSSLSGRLVVSRFCSDGVKLLSWMANIISKQFTIERIQIISPYAYCGLAAGLFVMR
jgi:hypothetical protein